LICHLINSKAVCLSAAIVDKELPWPEHASTADCDMYYIYQ
jgi:hypothetical protein